MDPDVIILLSILEFEDFSKLPKMKELTSQFRKLSLKRHPDKPTGTKEEFQELISAYEKLGKIIENTTKDDHKDDDETLARKLFKQYNFEKENTYSFTISIKNNEYSSWEKVFLKHFGTPIDRSANSNGKQFMVNHNEGKIFVTLYHKPKSPSGTLYIQAEKSRHFLNIAFVSQSLPGLYAEVLEMHEESDLETIAGPKVKEPLSKTKIKQSKLKAHGNPGKKKQEKKTEIKAIEIADTQIQRFQCDVCAKTFQSSYHLEYHMSSSHPDKKAIESNSKKRKRSEDKESSQECEECDKNVPKGGSIF